VVTVRLWVRHGRRPELFENPHPGGRRQLSRQSKNARVLRRTQYSSAASSVAQGTPTARKSADPYFGFKSETLYVEDYNASYLDEIERLRPDLEMDVYEEDIFDRTTGCGRCLCPDWMVEAGIEGWDDSVLEAHNDYYSLTSALMLWLRLCLDFSPLVVFITVVIPCSRSLLYVPVICLPIPFYRQVVINSPCS